MMPKLRKMVACIFLMLLIVQSGRFAPDAFADSTVNDSMKSVVRVLVQWYYRGQYITGATGTGICVGGEPVQYVITNKHVVYDNSKDLALMCYATLSSKEKENKPELDFVFEFDYNRDVKTEIYVVADDVFYEVDYPGSVKLSGKADLALLCLNEQLRSRKPIRFGNSEKQKTVDKVFALGYPGLADVDDNIELTSGIEHITVSDGIISRKDVVVDGVKHIQQTATIAHGNSGGPLVNEKGSLLGVNTWYTSDSDNAVFFAIDVEEVKSFLRDHGVSWLDGESASSGSGGSGTSAPEVKRPGPDDIKGCDSRVEQPGSNSWLSDYVKKTVKSKLGNGIILRYMPIQDFDYYGYNNLGLVTDGTRVTELAQENGFSLIKTSDGQIGWVPSHLIV